MRHAIALLVASLASGCAMTAPRDTTSPEAVVQRQLDAYTRHDLDAFMATYREDAKVWRMPATAPALDGAEAICAFYRDARFNVPALHAELVARTVVGGKVADHERVTGLRPTATEALAVYEVVDGRIANVWLYAP
ncbi:nuclear transport factor 2 family protein [Cognatilysobacter segetis]|uniref:nuclear transport factor 2 family protein n=1 Tax=Cognatilysobacter segetis TaxID=2492394 RepID=UPI00192E5726|nr:nuclear transport factor 2 family protein [Lysobacter segetis]